MLSALILFAGLAASTLTAQGLLPRVLIETQLGSIEVEVDNIHAPLTAGNFLRYVDARAYDNGRFHRTVKPDNQPDNKIRIEVIQASRSEDAKGFDAIALERTSVTGLAHKNGVISMARSAPDTATSDFFICIGDQPSLDYGGFRNPDGQGFAAFGRVVRGMDVVLAIQQAPSRAQRLEPAVPILSIRRIKP